MIPLTLTSRIYFPTNKSKLTCINFDTTAFLSISIPIQQCLYRFRNNSIFTNVDTAVTFLSSYGATHTHDDLLNSKSHRLLKMSRCIPFVGSWSTLLGEKFQTFSPDLVTFCPDLLWDYVSLCSHCAKNAMQYG